MQGLDPSIIKKPDDADGLTKRDKEINEAVVMGETYATEYLRKDFEERAKKFGLSQMQNWYFATDAIMRAAVELYKEDPSCRESSMKRLALITSSSSLELSLSRMECR